MQRNDYMSQNVHLTLTGRQKDETGETALTRHSCSAEYFEKILTGKGITCVRT